MIKNLTSALNAFVAAGEAREDDLVVSVEYERIHLRAARKNDRLPGAPDRYGYRMTRESSPIHDGPEPSLIDGKVANRLP